MRIQRELLQIWPQLLFVLLAACWFYRAYFFTFYGIGVYSFVDIFLVIALALLGLRFLVKQTWRSAWRGAWIAGSLITLFHLSFNLITTGSTVKNGRVKALARLCNKRVCLTFVRCDIYCFYSLNF